MLRSDRPSEYALLDLAGGRQLGQFGALIVDRPYPAAVEPVADPAAWTRADLRYERPDFGGDGSWVTAASAPPDAWTMHHDDLTFELRATATGQVGFFGEQVELWPWIRESVQRATGRLRGASGADAAAAPAAPPAVPAVLNLFAYTGGSTLAAAAEGAAVTHVDASRSAVAWARRNAELSGLADAPIRWIVDDVLAFVRREVRRGRRYDGIVLDPPSYGHGPHGERWTLIDHLPELLDACLAVFAEQGFLLLTAHAERLLPDDLADALRDAFVRANRREDARRVHAARLTLRAESGAAAAAGVAVKWRS